MTTKQNITCIMMDVSSFLPFYLKGLGNYKSFFLLLCKISWLFKSVVKVVQKNFSIWGIATRKAMRSHGLSTPSKGGCPFNNFESNKPFFG